FPYTTLFRSRAHGVAIGQVFAEILARHWMSACRKRVHCILDDPTSLAFAAGAALLQQQAQPPWLAWLMLLPLCVGLAVRVRPSGVPGGNDAAQQSKLRAARGKQRRL